MNAYPLFTRGLILLRACVLAAVTSLAFLLTSSPGQAQICSNPPAPSISSSTVPTDVDSFPSGCLPINFFDDYSWKTFIALIWPALAGQRGVPDPGQKLGATSGPLV